jgi:hypothetical protein
VEKFSCIAAKRLDFEEGINVVEFLTFYVVHNKIANVEKVTLKKKKRTYTCNKVIVVGMCYQLRQTVPSSKTAAVAF